MSRQTIAKLRIRQDMRCSTVFTGEYHNRARNTFVRIMENGDVMNMGRQHFDNSDASGVLVLVFDAKTTEHNIEFDLSDISDLKSDYRANFALAMKSGKEDFRKFISALVNHPNIHCNHLKEMRDEAIPKLGNPIFELEIPEFVKRDKVVATRDIINTSSQIAAMTADERRQLCYFFGFSPMNMSNDDVFEKLLGEQSGAIRDAENMRRFKEVYCAFGEADADKFKMMMNIKKAIVYARSGYGPFQDKGVDGFWRGTEFVGRDEDSIMAYLTENSSVYKSFVEPSIKEIEESDEFKGVEVDGEISAIASQEQRTLRSKVGGKIGPYKGSRRKEVPEGAFDDDDV